ncbi:hypothetical protein ACFQ77_06510 [Streptomyces virginiae]|uniref:hypothetical protein n=1 Tax=Streptomyces virginiae TaxID=1961 RepID=UPI00368A099C
MLGQPRLDDRTVLNGIVWKFRATVSPSPTSKPPVSASMPSTSRGATSSPTSGPCDSTRTASRTDSDPSRSAELASYGPDH